MDIHCESVCVCGGGGGREEGEGGREGGGGKGGRGMGRREGDKLYDDFWTMCGYIYSLICSNRGYVYSSGAEYGGLCCYVSMEEKTNVV